MNNQEFELLRSITNNRYLAQVRGRSISAVWLTPDVPAIVMAASPFESNDEIFPIGSITSDDILLLPIRMTFREYLRKNG